MHMYLRVRKLHIPILTYGLSVYGSNQIFGRTYSHVVDVMAYPNLSSDNDPGAFTVELTEKQTPMDQGAQIGFDGLDDRDQSAPNEQRQLLTSDTNLARPRLNTAQRVSCM